MAEENSRFIRWQRITIDQFGYSSNLIIALATATLAYSIAFGKDADFIAAKARLCVGVALLVGSSALAVSVLLGLLCTLNRLRDFRATAKRARDAPGALPKKEVDEIGRCSWRLFYGQVWAFMVGAFLLVIVISVVRTPSLLSN
jgi:hypothetical protein